MIRTIKSPTYFSRTGWQSCCTCFRDLPFSEFHKCKSSESGYKPKCKECTKAYNKQYYARPENRGKNRQQMKAWVKNNPEKHKANISSYQKRKKHKIASIGAKRRAAKINATAKWANKHLIEEIYSESGQLTCETGIRHHVDHIIPLQGVDERGTPNVCGLHVETNLQILTISENCTKSNLFIPLNLLHNALRYHFYYWLCLYIRQNSLF